MCVVSMVTDHFTEKWRPLVSDEPYLKRVTQPLIPQADIDEFYRLLERAREYDRKHNEPECELEEKKETLRKLAKQLGVEIKFE